VSSGYKMEAASSPKTFVPICQTTQRHMPEDSIIHDCFIILLTVHNGDTQWHSWLRHCARRSQVRFPMVSLGFFIDVILIWPYYGPGVDSACNRNEYQEYFLGCQGGRCIELTTLPHSCADCLAIWEPQPPGTLRACPGL